MATMDSTAEIGKLTRRKLMKSKLVSSGTMRRRCTFLVPNGRLNRHGLVAHHAHPPRHDQSRHGEGSEQGGDDADPECNGESANRAGADEEQHRGGDERGDVGVQNGGKRAGKPGVDRSNGCAPMAHLLADALVYKHV